VVTSNDVGGNTLHPGNVGYFGVSGYFWSSENFGRLGEGWTGNVDRDGMFETDVNLGRLQPASFFPIWYGLRRRVQLPEGFSKSAEPCQTSDSKMFGVCKE
jgi:hypothetical protein